MNRGSYRRLARAVVIRAALDSVMLRFPGTTRRELLEWFRSERRDRAPTKSAIAAWQREQAAAIRLFFEDSGAELASAGGCYDVIAKLRRPINHNRIWKAWHRRNLRKEG